MKKQKNKIKKRMDTFFILYIIIILLIVFFEIIKYTGPVRIPFTFIGGILFLIILIFFIIPLIIYGWKSKKFVWFFAIIGIFILHIILTYQNLEIIKSSSESLVTYSSPLLLLSFILLHGLIILFYLISYRKHLNKK